MMDEKEAFQSRIQSVIEMYSYSVGQFAYDKAKEMLEKERDMLSSSKSNQMSAMVSSMLTAMAQLAAADKNYMALTFLAPKGFFRKDVVKGTYETLIKEFERLEERGIMFLNEMKTRTSSSTPSSPTNGTPNKSPTSKSPTSSTLQVLVGKLSRASTASPTPSSSSNSNTSSNQSSTTPVKTVQTTSNHVFDKLAAHICGQLNAYVKAKIQMIFIYERIVLMSEHKFCIFDDIVISLKEIIATSHSQFHHPLLSQIKTGFTFETEILLSLLRAHVDIQHWRFLPSLFNLQEAHAKLVSWTTLSLSQSLPSQSSLNRTRFVSLVRSSSIPLLYQWLCNLKSSLMSKFSLYFYEMLNKQSSSPAEIKSVCAKSSIDYFQKIVSFHQKSDAYCISIVFDTHGEEDYKGAGYQSPFIEHEIPQGIDSFPVIFSYPFEKHINHMPALIMIMNSKSKEIETNDSMISFYDNQVQNTFFLARPDPKMTFVVIFESHKSDKDTLVLSFMQDLSNLLKGSKLFASLKPGK